MLGGFGDAEILSFHATKFVTASEGGAIVTNDDTIAGRARQMRNFGFRNADLVTSLGTNGKIGEFSAAMGITSLESIEHFTEVNRRNYFAYRRELHAIPGIKLLDYDHTEHCNYQYVVIEIDEPAKLSRNQLLRVLLAEGVIARRYFYPGCHRMEPYRSNSAVANTHLPVTEHVAARVLQLPTGTSVDEAAIAVIAAIIRTSVEHASDVNLLGPVDSERVYDEAAAAFRCRTP